MKVWLLLGLLLVHEALEDVTGQHPPKNKRPKEPGENRIKPTNKKVKPKIPRTKDRDSADSLPKAQSIMTQMMDKGRFQKPAATLSLTAGQTLELRCKGNKIVWSYPAYLDAFKDSRLSVKQNERYGQLTLVNSTAADTGEFSCWGQLCNGYICRKDEAKMGSTYIFFTEKGELFVPSPSYFDIVYLNPDRQAVVPCRVTVLSAKVTLHREFPAKEIPANGTDIVYDMKRGFVYLQPHSDHQGVVYCKAEAGGKSQISVKYQLLYAEGKPASYQCLDFSCFRLVNIRHPFLRHNFKHADGYNCYDLGVAELALQLQPQPRTFPDCSDEQPHIQLFVSTWAVALCILLALSPSTFFSTFLFPSYELLADLMGSSPNYKCNGWTWGVLDDDPILDHQVPSGPPSTTILASSNKVKSGDDISVLCTVLGEPDIEVEFRWIYPGQKDERPVTIQDTWRLIHRGLGHTTRISQSVMTVEDFETIDAGYYICTAQNLRGQTTVATTVESS
ncbi:Platelet-derived growth factor receptor-like protein [Pteropus alecto]|uniref:Platelet-derived growth factor receptor-like protein n=1 Tax=Pteropus alecto TaxID=9402 RepID=L5KED2_PTEAL|nr:Platelet-derived growth factor receptor-like protein [Pteropus alecto]